MNRVEMLMEDLFSGREQTQELVQMRAEMTANCEERFTDLVRSGMTEDEAAKRLQEDLAGVEELLGNRIDPTERFRSVCVETTDANVRILEGDAFSVLQYSGERKAQPYPHGVIRDNTLYVKIPVDPVGAWLFSSKRNEVPSALLITLPLGCYDSVSVRTVSGDVSALLQCKRLEIESKSGDIKAQGEAEEARLKSAAGDVLSQVTGKLVAVESNSGDVWVQGNAEAVRVKSISGDALCDGQIARAEINSVSGDATANLSGKTLETLNVRTVSGDILIHFTDAPERIHVQYRSLSGDTQCGYADAGQDAPVTVQAFTASGDIFIR